MARKKIAISSSGGIAAGSPFVDNAALFVEQASPPVANTNRLARIVDAMQSIVAPGASGAPHTFVMGEGAREVVDGARSVLIGYHVQQGIGSIGTEGSTDQILIGNNLTIPDAAINAQGTIIIGSGLQVLGLAGAPSFGGNTIISYDPTLTGYGVSGGEPINNVLIGAGAAVTGAGCVAIGAVAVAYNASVAIGSGAQATGVQSTVVGSIGSVSADHGVAVGHRARADMDAVSLGWFTDALGDSSVAIGRQAASTGGQGSIAIGREATTGIANNAIALGREANNGVDNWCLIGSRNYPINVIRFGGGVNDSSGNHVYTLQTTEVYGGAGNNLVGNGLVIAAGVGTGNWANAEGLGLDFQVGLAIGSGSTRQTYASGISIRHADLNVAFWGGLGATFGGGAQVMFLANAGTVPGSNPTGGGLLYVEAGALKWRGSGGTVTVLGPA